jgi:APA family basic amino acid/polyamine antiporter
MRRSNVVNAVIVSITLASLVCFVAAGSAAVDARNLVPFFGGRANDGFGIAALLETTALMFVAYTGYARIATLGEEIKEPRKTIPKAIVASVFVAMALYVAVAIVGVGVAGSDVLLAATEQQAAPLAVIAERFSMPISGDVLVIGGLTAMLGVLLNLALGLSRVVLAMARRGDLPAALGRLSAKGVTPPWAVLLVAAVVALLVAIGDVGTTWSLSAFSVLIYYALTNLAALRMPPDRRRYPRWVAGLGLVASIVLVFWIETQVLAAGVCALLIGLAWRAMIRRRSRP